MHQGEAACLPDNVVVDSEIAKLFLSHSSRKLRGVAGQIEVCSRLLTDDQIWARSGRHENSIGNLILHLCGNVRQWIGAGVGGEEDKRDRDSEFSATGGVGAAELMARLHETVDDAAKILDGLPAERLLEEIHPQNHAVSVLEAIYQVVGHFQQHAGQIMFVTKMHSEGDLRL